MPKLTPKICYFSVIAKRPVQPTQILNIAKASRAIENSRPCANQFATIPIGQVEGAILPLQMLARGIEPHYYKRNGEGRLPVTASRFRQFESEEAGSSHYSRVGFPHLKISMCYLTSKHSPKRQCNTPISIRSLRNQSLEYWDGWCKRQLSEGKNWDGRVSRCFQHVLSMFKQLESMLGVPRALPVGPVAAIAT